MRWREIRTDLPFIAVAVSLIVGTAIAAAMFASLLREQLDSRYLPLEDIAWACIRPWRWIGTEHIGGLMDRAGFYAKYEEYSGLKIDEDSVRFWEVLGNAKLAAIFLTGGRSYCEGRTHSPMMAFIARNVRRLELEIMDLMGV